MPARRPRRRTAVLLAAALTLAAATASCTESEPSGPTADDTIARSTTTTAAASTTATTQPTTTTLTPEAKVEAAYLEATDAYYDLVQHPSAPDQRLEATRIDPNLSYIRSILAKLAADGLVGRYPGGRTPVVTVRSVRVAGQSATIAACEIDNGQQVRTSDDTVVNDEVVSVLYQVQLRLTDGRWKVQSETESQTWPDGKGCDR